MKDTLEAGEPALTQAAGETGDLASAGTPVSAETSPEQPSALSIAAGQDLGSGDSQAAEAAVGSPDAPEEAGAIPTGQSIEPTEGPSGGEHAAEYSAAEVPTPDSADLSVEQGAPATSVPPNALEASMESPPSDDFAEPRRGRKRPRPGERRLQILQTLAEMLEAPHADRVTTAALAARIQVSEAALYRHFASKAQMFEGLIDFIEQTLFGLINQITACDEDGLLQLQSILTMLLSFSERNPGMTRVLIGDALVTENTRLQARVNQIVDRLEISLKQCFRTAVAQGRLPDNTDPAGRANLVLSYVLGRWLRFAKGGFKRAPTEGLDAQVMLLIS